MTRPAVLAAWLVVSCGVADLAAQPPTDETLQKMSLDELLQLELTTATRRPEIPAASPVSVTVLTQDDIRRSGATSLPDLLRRVPGVHVAQMDGHTWAVGIRGFADRLSRGMLVMIDGRTVYTPLFAGVYWEMQDTLLHDIDRIEVVRGPGGTLWGANAVTGIVNIITRGASSTQGLVVQAGGGNVERGMLNARYGGRLGDAGAFRVYGKWFDRGPSARPGVTNIDDWHMTQGGFRADWRLRADRTFTVQGDVYGGQAGQRVTAISYVPPFRRLIDDDLDMTGGNVLARWTSGTRAGRNTTLQTYVDYTHRNEALFDERRRTFDIDLQQALAPRGRQRLLWGLGYRVSAEDTEAVPLRGMDPEDRTTQLFSGFVQDHINLVPGALDLVVGGRVDHNVYTGFEVQPSARLVWSPGAVHAVVASAARAVRTPSRVERDYTTGSLLSAQLPLFLRVDPNRQFESESLRGYELSYRVRPSGGTYFTVSGFFNHHLDTLSTQVEPIVVETDAVGTRLVLPVQFRNDLHGNSHGVEATADVRPTPWWRWTAAYSALRVQLTENPGASDASQEARGEGGSPRHQFFVTSGVDLPGNLEADWFYRRVGRLPAYGVPAYGTSDVRFAWQPTRRWTFELIGRNLHDATHVEFEGSGPDGMARIRRGAYARVTTRW